MEARADTSAAPSFELTFRPSIDLITIVRGFVADFYLKVTSDDDAASRLALATHELLENAAKYSTDGAADLGVRVDPRDGSVHVRMGNRAAPAQVERLRACFDEIRAAESAADLYAEILRRSAVLETGSGGLGLARIWAESEMTMELIVDGERVEIHARGQIATAG
jgi:two-component sensor histidine kinase